MKTTAYILQILTTICVFNTMYFLDINWKASLSGAGLFLFFVSLVDTMIAFRLGEHRRKIVEFVLSELKKIT